MTLSVESKEKFKANPATFIEQEIKTFTSNSPLNRMPPDKEGVIFDEPIVRFADGDDTLFLEYKKVVAPNHLTPREALAQAYNKNPAEMPARLSVISWILPITEKTRKSNREEKQAPSRPWSYTRWYGEKFNDALRAHVVQLLTDMGYLATAPSITTFFKRDSNEKGPYSNWSERHVAFAAGQGTFSLSDGFISDCGIAHRCGSAVTSLELPPSNRTAKSPYSNCLFYIDASCKACITRCPGDAISEKGHDKKKCQEYAHTFSSLKEEYGVGVAGCGLCQVKVPCEFNNPAKKAKKTG